MNRQLIKYALGKLLIVEALLLVFPLIVSIGYQEASRYPMSYVSVIALLLTIGFSLSYKKPQGIRLRAREGAIVVALGWLLLAFFGGIPFVLSGDIPSLVDAFFETASGFTTTGSSILKTLAPLSKSSLFWRSFTHLIGGMGVLVFTMAVLKPNGDDVQLMKAEVPGPVFGKLLAKISDTARILYGIYLVMTFLFTAVLFLGGVPFFDALLLAFGTAGTGGFAISDAGFTLYANPVFVEYAISIGMLLFGINFNLYFFFLIGHVKEVFQDEELKYYLGIVIGSILVLIITLLPTMTHFEETFRHVLFTVSSIITTTGYSTADFGTWPLVSQMIILLLMFFGGCAGSTAGGLKISRIVLFCKESLSEVRRIGYTNRIVTTRFNGKLITKKDMAKLSGYLFVYAFCFIIIMLLLSLDAPDFLAAFSSTATALNNIGPGLGAVGPTSNFSAYSDFSKLIMALTMIAGRLEIFPIIILLTPSTLWQLIKIKNKHAV